MHAEPRFSVRAGLFAISAIFVSGAGATCASPDSVAPDSDAALAETGSGDAAARDGDARDDGAGDATGDATLHDAGPGDGSPGEDAPGDARAPVTTVSDVHGTWVLALGEKDKPRVAAAFGDAGDLVGVSVRLPWDALVKADGTPDFSVLDGWRQFVGTLRPSSPPLLAVRFIAGVHTPWSAYADLAPTAIHVTDDDGGDAGFIPSPCLADGGPNTLFEAHYLSFMSALDAWARGAGASIVHLSWYGRMWSEIYTGPEVLASCHDLLPDGGTGRAADSHLVGAYDHLFDLALGEARRDGVTIEYPLSGQGGVVPYANAIQAHMESAVFPDGGDGGEDGRLLVQSQAWGLDGHNNVPLGGAYWSCVSIPHGFQAAQVNTCSIDGGPPTDWHAMYDAVRACNGVYTEVYLMSFECQDPSSGDLANEIHRYAGALPPYASCPDGG